MSLPFKKASIGMLGVALYLGNISLDNNTGYLEDDSDFITSSSKLSSGWSWGFTKANASSDCTINSNCSKESTHPPCEDDYCGEAYPDPEPEPVYENPGYEDPDYGNPDYDEQSDGGSSSSDTRPTDPPKTPRQECLENVDLRYQTCKAQASADYSTYLHRRCRGSGEGTISGGVGLEGSFSVDKYEQCKDLGLSIRDNANQVCEVFKSAQTRSCP